MKRSLNIFGSGLMVAMLLLSGGCESDSANAANTTMPPDPAVTSPPVEMTGYPAGTTVPESVATTQADAVQPDATAVDQPLPATLDPDSPIAGVLKLAQAGVGESVVLSYISNSSVPFNLDSDQIIYLRDLGLSDAMITAMIQRDQALGNVAAVPPTSVAPETNVEEQAPTTTVVQTVPADANYTYFYDSLSPYGSWVEIEGYGRCWQPTVVIVNRNWQPYCDSGHWVYSDCGWYWVSDYSWGWAPFHYGRWFRDSRRGWCWAPDSTWGPSWVSWRYNNDYCGWAPLPPAARYHSGVGFTYRGRNVDVSFNFGLTSDCFTFVPTARFSDRHLDHYRAPRNQETRIYNNTTVINNIVVGNNNTIINRGLGTERFERVTHQTIRPVHIQENKDRDPRGGRHEQFEAGRNTLIVNRPPLREHVANNNHNVRNANDNHAPSPVVHSPGNRGNNAPDNNRGDDNQRNRGNNNPRAINTPNPSGDQRDGRNANNDNRFGNVRSPANQANNAPPNNNPPHNNVVTQPSSDKPSPFTPARPNPPARENNPPRRVNMPATPANPITPKSPTTPVAPVIVHQNPDSQRNNQRPVLTQPTPAPRTQSPIVTAPANNHPITRAPGDQNSRRTETPRYNSPRVESQIPPPKTTPVVPPAFPRNNDSAAGRKSSDNGDRSYTPPANNTSPQPRGDQNRGRQDSDSRSGGGDRDRGGNRGNDRRNP